MTFISYAQNFEDVLLRRTFPDVRDGFYVDAGAWEPVRESVTKAFYDMGWHGINIEPSPTFEQLAFARPRDVNLRLALGAAPGKMPLRVHRIGGEVLQASTLVHVAPPRVEQPEYLRTTVEMVEVMPLAKVLDQHAPGQHIHFLKIDVEGAEEAVIRGADWRRYRPEVVLIEATWPQTSKRNDSSWRPLMLAAGYMPVLFDGLNAWFLREESRERQSCFTTPPNVFDNFRVYDAEAAQRIAAAEERAAAAEALTGQLEAQQGPGKESSGGCLASGEGPGPRKVSVRAMYRAGLGWLRKWSSGGNGASGQRPVPREALVRALYRACLGRLPEPEGLSGWVQQLDQADGTFKVVKAIMTSAEAHSRLAPPPDTSAAACQAIAQSALQRLGRRPRIVDIGARMLEGEPHAYDALRRITPIDVVGFEPQASRIAERLASEGGDGLVLLPYAIGDGKDHALHINNDDATSSLFELNINHNAPLNHLQDLRTVRTERLQTRRLDDVLPDGPVDFLKLDIQGAELMALRHATAVLARTAVVHCEVEFSPIYSGQPLFAEVHAFLAGQMFQLVDLVNLKRYHYPRGAGPHDKITGERLVWADAVFFRITQSPEVLTAQALVATQLYRKATMGRHLLAEADGLQHSGHSLPRA